MEKQVTVQIVIDNFDVSDLEGFMIELETLLENWPNHRVQSQLRDRLGPAIQPRRTDN